MFMQMHRLSLPTSRPARPCRLASSAEGSTRAALPRSVAVKAAQTAEPVTSVAGTAPQPGQATRGRQERLGPRNSAPYERDGPRRGPRDQQREARPQDPGTVVVSTRTSPDNVLRALQSFFRDQAKSTDTFRIVCIGPETIPTAIRAVAEANARYAGAQAPYRLKVMSSVRRFAGERATTALEREDFRALLFVTKMPANETPSPSPDNATRVSRSSVWTKLCGYLYACLEKTSTPLSVSTAGSSNLVTAYKSLMLARYQILRGPRPTDEPPAEGVPSAPRERKPYTEDVAFVPTVQVTIEARKERGTDSETMVELSVVTLTAFKCEPPAISANPDLRLQTPRPSRAASATREDEDPETWRQRRPRERPASTPSSAETMIVSTQEWDNVNAKLETMAEQQAQLIQLLDKVSQPDSPAPAAQ